MLKMTASVHQKSTLDGLPKPFVSAMRTLFELMDDKRTGFVKFADIENHWHEGACISRGLPNGVVDSLRKVTPSNGLLSFERFCAGLRICLLRHEPSRRIENRPNHNIKQRIVSRPASVPLPESGNRKPVTLGKVLSPSSSTERLPGGLLSPHPPSRMVRYNTATVRPNNVTFAQQRAISMPHLQTGVKTYQPPKRDDQIADFQRNKNEQKRVPPPIPMSRTKVTMALEKWRMMKSYHSPQSHEPQQNNIKLTQPLREMQLRPNSASYPTLPTEPTVASDGDSGVCVRVQERGPAAKKANRRREPRRHTVSNGIDYNMIKRLKLLEQEKDFLLQGLDSVERARNWYIQQVGTVNEKLEQVSKWDTPHSEYSMDALHERLNFQMTRIFEVNQHLNALMETSEKGFPIHMNLAVHQRNIYDQQRNSSQAIQRLKEQNHSLTEEIGKKSEIITQLEAEKSALIRELFQARTQQKKDSNDTTLW